MTGALRSGVGAVALRIVRLGAPRAKDEGTRIGTVRRPPRGVPKAQHASQDWYDVWYPNLAPDAETVKLAQAAQSPALSPAESDARWAAFVRRYRAEMARPDNARSLDLLAALSRHANFSVGCYCEDESRCHRSVLRELLRERGALIREAP